MPKYFVACAWNEFNDAAPSSSRSSQSSAWSWSSVCGHKIDCLSLPTPTCGVWLGDSDSDSATCPMSVLVYPASSPTLGPSVPMFVACMSFFLALLAFLAGSSLRSPAYTCQSVDSFIFSWHWLWYFAAELRTVGCVFLALLNAKSDV